ncbi:uncharacterized protein LOC129983607 [Argiope bruennichi]|uniref:uncharacterized protein LOC129983607 n=1 Tax=Argiope bruennichi TaxID=94029 RepID=UPI002495A758|nr:uncharacterized protein LOC129983607 [Argiope bruennichi]
MGEGVTNPVRGAASSSSVHSTAEVVITSLLSAERFEDCLHLVVLVSLACVFAAHWMITKRKDWSRTTTELTHSQSEDTLPEHSSRSCSVESSGGVLATGLTRKSEPHLRRSEIVCKTGRTVSSLDNFSNGESTSDSPTLSISSDVSELDICALSEPSNTMDTSGDVPQQPDSFFTWDSGGSSGEYSFVHTAVELPKYPDGAITEEEKQMLLLYMQTGHPELLLSSSQVGPVQSASDNLICDPAAVARGFLETIVEETSDDLRSPSECDEASVGWGSWDESDDEDRLTVVEMVTSANHRSEVSPGPVYTSADMSNQKGGFSDQLSSVSSNSDQLLSLGTIEDLLPNCDISTDHRKDDNNTDISFFETSNYHSTNNGGVNDMDNVTSQQCDDVFQEINSEGIPGNMNATRQLGVSPDLDSLIESNVNSSFDTLWITANGLESPSETLNPWIVNRFLDPKDHSLSDQNNLDFTVNRQTAKCEESLLFLESDDICLVPSSQNTKETESETLMFSDNFKDYFLPSENYVPGFSKDDLIDPNEMPSECLPTDSPQKKGMRCFRIGFEAAPTEQFSVSHLDQSMICEDTDQKPCLDYSDSDSEASKTKRELQDTMFSPVEGDIVYGSSWVSSRPLKEPEKISSGAEVHCSTAQTEVRQSPTMQSESLSPDNNRRSPELCASDDDTPVVPNSLSRWRHHTDLMHLQEATSPIARWQHESDLQNTASKCKQTYSSDESDDGLPPQLKEIYSSFKMKDNKMGRIRIKEDKNNNFKRLGLWDNESKVTLPPFNLINNDAEKIAPKQKEQSSSREDLDDLDIDMFTVAKSSSGSKLADKGDSDVDDALRSFNHLDDYTSDENSENENNYPVNVRDKLENVESEPISIDEDLKNTNLEIIPSEKNHSSLENPCSDNSDNCPLCTDPSFKKSHINDLFSLKTSENAENDVQSLLQKTYPKMVRLSQSNLSDPEIHELTTEPNKAADSVSTLTSSDSDEGNRKVKEIKKRIKKRPKESANAELKHDDSGYVEDDEDDDEEDSLGEKKDMSICSSNPDITRKSLSTAFYESKLLKSESNNEESSSYSIPETFQEFSKQLQQSMNTDEMKAEFLEAEKWNIPENLSQFSAWLLDKELMKISNREEMEKLFVDDIMSLREQTIAKFLKNSYSADDAINLKSSDTKGIEACVEKENAISPDDVFNSVQSLPNKNTELNEQNPESNKNNTTLKSEYSDLPEWDFNIETPTNFESSTDGNDNQDKILDVSLCCETKNSETHIDSQASDDSSSSFKNKTDSDNELSEEYYNYNFNKKVNNVFGEYNLDQMIGTSKNSPGQFISSTIEKNIEFPQTTIESEAEIATIQQPPELVAQQINISDTEATVLGELGTTCYNNYKPDSTDNECNNSADAETDNSEAKPLTDNAELLSSLQPEASIIYHPSASEDTTKILSKVNDTTIQLQPVTENEEKALPELISSDCPEVMPSAGSIPNQNITSELECGNNVAPSTEESSNNLDGSRELAGADFDLMTQGVVVSGEKGAFEGCAEKEADDISSLEALVVSRESDRETHVQENTCHAHRQDGTAPLILDNSDSFHVCGVLDSCLVNIDNSDLNSDSVIGDSVRISDNVNIVSEGEECCVPEGVASVPEERSHQASAAEFTTFNCFAAAADIKDCVTAAKEITIDVGDCSFEAVHSEVEEVSGQCSSDDSKILISDVTCSELIINDIPGNNDLSEINYGSVLNDELIISEDINHLENVDNSPSVEISDNRIESNKPDVVSCCEKVISSGPSSPEIPIYRIEYKRSNSLGREPEEHFEPISSQSKSTPDLRRCHEQQLRSTQPLSALLSKSVSQRIQDYLGSSSRGDRLLRSLPPNERSRHYRRICVSTETVVERAARFEARSQSSRPPPRDESPFKIRSGSCPPSSMKNNTSWISERNYSKPTATVRPTIDTYRNGIHKLSNGDAFHRNIFLDQIAGYSKSKHKNGETEQMLSNGQTDPTKKEDFMELITGYTKATKVTHKPPVAPSSNHSSMKTARLKGKLATARKQFFERISSNQELSISTDSIQKDQSDDEDPSTCGLSRFNEFRRSARAERARLAASHPDLGALEAAVRSSKRRIDQLKKRNNKKSEPPHEQIAPMPSTKEQPLLPYRRCTGEIAWASCAQRVREAAERRKQLQQLEIVDQRDFPEEAALRAHSSAAEEDDESTHSAIAGGALEFLGSRARSMDFLLDADNRERALPPENRLATSGGGARVKSEHELRIERSLQNLTIPDWYKQSAWSKKPKEGFILRRGSEGSAGESRKRWQGFSSSRTPSATSLTTTPTSYSQRNIVVPKRVTPTSDWRSLVSSRESLTPASPASLSPREGTFHYTLSTSSLSRWSSSRLSTSSAPLTALSVHRSFRQPYLGWRAAAASSSGGASRSSPGISPVNATTPLQGSRPGSPRRGSQEHPFVYGLQQNQITSAATLRPDGSESADTSRISPLALNTTNVFFNSNVEGPDTFDTAPSNRFATAEMRRDRYSYTQSLYSGTVIVSPGTTDDDRRNYNLDQIIDENGATADERFGTARSPQPPPRIWMESSFVGTKKDGSEPIPNTRSIRIVPSDSARVGGDRFGASTTGTRGGTCATQTAMGEYVLRDFRRFGITL